MLQKLFPVFLFLAFVSRAQQPCINGRFGNSEVFVPAQLRIDTGIIYAKAQNPFTGRRESLKLDIYYPRMTQDTMRSRPIILLVHGGGFETGSRLDEDYFCREYAKRGYVAATIDYRLGWGCSSLNDPCGFCVSDSSALRTATYMAVQDCRSALHFIARNANSWHIDPQQVFLFGTSAGSIAGMLSVAWNQERANAFAPGAEALLGPLDLPGGNAVMSAYTVRACCDFCGALAGDSLSADALAVPVISFHDEYDCMVPYVQGSIFCGCHSFYRCTGPRQIFHSLQARGICASLNTVPGSSEHCSYPAENLLLRSTCFFKRLLCGECPADTSSTITTGSECDSLGTEARPAADSSTQGHLYYPEKRMPQTGFPGNEVQEGQSLRQSSFCPLSRKIPPGANPVPAECCLLACNSADGEKTSCAAFARA